MTIPFLIAAVVISGPIMHAMTRRARDGDGGRRREHRRAGNATRRAEKFLLLFGRTRIFDEATLKSLYPTHDAFVKKFAAAADALEKRGFRTGRGGRQQLRPKCAL